MEFKAYKVVKIDENLLKNNGKGTHALREKAIELTDFSSPWKHAPIKKITFKALRDDTNLYWCFKVDEAGMHLDATCLLYTSDAADEL